MSRLLCASLLLTVAVGAEPALDADGDPLPEGAAARIGSLRFRCGGGCARRLAVAPDGKRIAVSTHDPPDGCSVVLFETKTGRVLRRMPGLGGPVAFSPDGTLIVSGDGQGKLVLWE